MSVVTTTEKAKVLVVRRHDKKFLSEDVKFNMDQLLLQKDFQDFDRPMPTVEAIHE